MLYVISIVYRNVKLQVITDDLLQRQKEYRTVNWEYRKKLAEWIVKYKKKLDMMKSILGATKKPDEPVKAEVLPRNQLADIVVDGLEMNPKTGYPKIMTFRALMSNQEMIQLIEKGFLLASEMK